MNRNLPLAILFALHFLSSVPADDFPATYNSEQDRSKTPVPASVAAETMKLPSGFRATVFASEPDVQNPIAMNWDHRGRLWVAENYTYAERTMRFDLSLRDRVLVFEDSNHDGEVDSRKVFTDDVQMLTSVETGRGGVWLMCPPQLLFVPDQNEDLIPDGPAQVILDGFSVAQDNYHNFANGLKWGPDGWLYGRCGHSCPGQIGLPNTPNDLRIPIDGGIWRYHPERKVYESLCHGTTNPWGHDWDRHGELFFINTVIGHLWHMVPGSHLKESFGESMNPYVYERMDMIADHYHFDTKGSWTDSRNGNSNDLGGGHAHIGATIYLGESWPNHYRDRLLTLNMHGLRANVERLERMGAGFVGRHEPDFLISQDPFFRGIDLNFGPDGNLFVIDWSDTGECHESTGVHRDSGRIFKISYGPSQVIKPVMKPACLAGDGKLPMLWRQYQAGQTTQEQLLALLDDPDENLRAWAIRLLVDFWPLDTILGPRADAQYDIDPIVYKRLLKSANEDSSGLVQLVLASTLQRLPVNLRKELALAITKHQNFAHDRDLPFLVWFGMIPMAQHDTILLLDVAANTQWLQIVRWSSRFVTSHSDQNPDSLDRLVALTANMPIDWQEQAIAGFAEGFQGWRRATKPASWEKLTETKAAKSNPEMIRDLEALFGDGRALEAVRKIAFDKKADMKMRTKALETLVDARPDDLQTVCESLLDTRILNTIAARGLALYDNVDVGRILAKSYRKFLPEDRSKILEILVSRKSFASALMEVLEQPKGAITVSDIHAFHARQIHALHDSELSKTFQRVWGELKETSAEKRLAMESLKKSIQEGNRNEADLVAGRKLFEKSCSQCHRMYGNGASIGPDLTGSQRSNLDYLLENILDPSAVVGKDFRMHVLQTEDGRTISGLLVSKDAKNVTIQTQSTREVIPIGEIERMKETELSSMPDGLLANLSLEQIRDLIAYLMHPSQVGMR